MNFVVTARARGGRFRLIRPLTEAERADRRRIEFLPPERRTQFDRDRLRAILALFVRVDFPKVPVMPHPEPVKLGEPDTTTLTWHRGASGWTATATGHNAHKVTRANCTMERVDVFAPDKRMRARACVIVDGEVHFALAPTMPMAIKRLYTRLDARSIGLFGVDVLHNVFAEE